MAEVRWPQRRWVWALWAGLPAFAVMLPYVFLYGHSVALEGGFLEASQAGIWIVTTLAAGIVSLRVTDRRCRDTTILLGVLAIGALCRELDLHILLNPEAIGPWGVRFRLDWWMDSAVHFFIKAAWATVGLLVALLIASLTFRSIGPMDWHRARPRLMAISVLMMVVAFTCDDLLRNRFDTQVLQLIEESVELIAAVCFLGAVLAPESASTDSRWRQ